jgi:hypothetical protein
LCGRGPAVVGRRGAASVAVVHGIAYPSRTVGKLRIRQVRLVCLVVRIELMMGREGRRGCGGCRHGCGPFRRVRTDVETLLLPQYERLQRNGEAVKQERQTRN